MMRYLATILLLIAITGCTSKYRVDSYESPTTRLDEQASFYVVLPKDGQYEGQVYQGSGISTASAVATALLVHVDKVVTGTVSGEDFEPALATARERRLSHVVNIIILHWEDRATEWSGITDKITLKLAVYDTQLGTPVSSTVTSASSKWGTMGGDHPQDLLPEPTKTFVDALF
jgi:Domain of unknown function (DUF4823)